MEKLIIVVFCYKKDFFLARPCVASIRYYYPDAELYLLKDYLAGDFDSTELEQAFDVRELDLGIKEYGWSAAKVHFALSNLFPGQRVLTLDCDIVLAGRFLEQLYTKTAGIDFVVDPEYYTTPYEGNVQRHYYNIEDVEKIDPQFKYPGYVFNGGQMIVTTGKIPANKIEPLFDTKVFPFYKRRDILPQVDQSLFNYLLPKLSQEGIITLAAESFMAWSDGEQVSKVELDKVKLGNIYPFLIHWAGVLRVPHLSKMTRADILLFFDDYYYSKVPMGALKKRSRRAAAALDFHLRNFYRNTVKPLIGK